MNGARWRIRTALPGDIDEVLALERATPESPHWSRSVYQAMLSPAGVGRRMFVAEGDSGVCGFSVGSLGPPPDLRGELESVAVASGVRRQQIGRALCEAVLFWCRDHRVPEVTLEVRSASSAPIALYRSLGFEVAGRRPGYYSDPSDAALIMRLSLQPPPSKEL